MPKQQPAAPFKPATATCHTFPTLRKGLQAHSISCNISNQQIKKDGLPQSDWH